MNSLEKKKAANLRDIMRGYKVAGHTKAPISKMKKSNMVRAIANLRARGVDASPRPAVPRGTKRPSKTPVFKKRPAVGTTVLAAKPVGELRAMARALEIRGAGSMKKAELIRVLMISRTPVDRRLPDQIRAKLLSRRQKMVPHTVRMEMAPFVAAGYREGVEKARFARFENALRKRAYAAGRASGDVMPNYSHLKRVRGGRPFLSPISE